MRLEALAIVGLLAMASARGTGEQGPEPDAPIILDSGSTNRPGFRIVVAQSGVAELTSMPRKSGDLKSGEKPEPIKPLRRMLPAAVLNRFYDDLQAAKPLASLPAVHCMKSVSFGSTLTVAFAGERTTDLSCGDGGNAAMGHLIRDVNEIIALVRAN
jgi:hypothetical protein